VDEGGQTSHGEPDLGLDGDGTRYRMKSAVGYPVGEDRARATLIEAEAPVDVTGPCAWAMCFVGDFRRVGQSHTP
jgi:hypothetical protein